MKRNWWIAGITGLLLVTGLTVVVMASDREDQSSDGNCAADNAGEPAETVLTLDQVPAAVAATIRREAAGATINEIVRKDGRGRSLYEAELITDGRERDLLVRPDGSVVGEEALHEVGEGDESGAADGTAAELDRDEITLTIDQVPAPVAAVIRREAAGAAITEIVKGNEDGRPVYEVIMAMNGIERELVLAADGAVREATVTIDQVPAPVAATIRRVGDGMTLREILMVNDNGQTVYEATLLSRGREGELRLAPDGSILPEEAEDAGEDSGDEDDDEGEDGR